MLYLSLFCAFVGNMCPKVSEKPMRSCETLMLSAKMDRIKYIWYDLVSYFFWGLGMMKIFSV